METINLDDDEDLKRHDGADIEDRQNEWSEFKKWLIIHHIYLEKALQQYAHELYPSKEDTHTRWLLKRIIRKQIRSEKMKIKDSEVENGNNT
jgi:hypothetical protein